MVGVKVNVKIDGLKELPKNILKAVKAASRARLKYLALQQQNAILKSQTPSGGAQYPNSQKTKDKKQAQIAKGKATKNIPLYKSGQLANALNWKASAGKNMAKLKPPTSRARIVYILMAKGYKLVFNDLPKRFEQDLDKEIQSELNKKVKQRKLKL